MANSEKKVQRSAAQFFVFVLEWWWRCFDCDFDRHTVVQEQPMQRWMYYRYLHCTALHGTILSYTILDLHFHYYCWLLPPSWFERDWRSWLIVRYPFTQLLCCYASVGPAGTSTLWFSRSLVSLPIRNTLAFCWTCIDSQVSVLAVKEVLLR